MQKLYIQESEKEVQSLSGYSTFYLQSKVDWFYGMSNFVGLFYAKVSLINLFLT